MQQVPSPLPTLLFPHLALLLAAAAVSGMAQQLLASAPRSDCPSTCGDVEIPYPFGIGDGCSFPGLDHFNLTCDYSSIPPKPLRGNIEIVNISLEDGVMRVFTHVAYICYNGSNSVESHGGVKLKLSPTYLISPTRNEFTAIGCDTEAFLAGNKDWSYFTGCITTCVSVNEAANEGDDCAGLGCCKTHISPNLRSISVYWNGGNNTSNNSAWNYSPCSYAFVAEKGWYNFSRKDLIVKGNNSFLSRVGHRSVKLILDWAIKSHGTCDLTSLSAPACVSAHSFCDVKATKGAGYLCKCSVGYSGNPYITGPGGCTNINECELRQSNPTKYGELYPCHRDARCKDTDGDYECRCKFWFRGEGKTKEGCIPIFPPYAIAILAIISVVLVTCLGFFLLQTRKQRKFFNQNGGDLLKNLAGVKIFTKRELKKITKSYSDCIGTGFFGDVYKGIVDAGTQAQEVAVKCTVARKVARLRQKVLRPDDQVSQQEQDNSWKDKFVREITFQFQIKHPNVVRLIGCCLETDVPILVFEFVRHGSLHDRLHPADKKPCTLLLLKRLDIAVGAAEAISHMHSRGDYNHVHGDIKPANILLDDNLNAKVSDFGSSMLLSVKMYAVGVAADGIYADPVYYKTGRFTVKSDVYSFGVVLLELITGRTARYDEKSLAIDFEKSCKDEEKRWSMYDPYILSDDDPRIIKLLDMIGALAVECLSGDEDKRPTMAEVVVELKNVRSMAGGRLCSEASENTPLIDGAS